jgi:hypothetical protein
MVMTLSRFDISSCVRWCLAAALALVLSACGGGGGGSDGQVRTISPATPALQGSWQLTISFDGTPRAPVDLAAGDVPTQTAASEFTAAAVAELVARTFPNKTVTRTDSTITVTDPDTSYVLVINSVSVSGYEGCGSCGVGSAVSVTLGVGFSESGRFDGITVPARSFNATVTLRYQRTA